MSKESGEQRVERREGGEQARRASSVAEGFIPPADLGLEFTDEVHTAADMEAELVANAQPNEALSALPHFIKQNRQQASRSDQTEVIHHRLEGARRAMEAADTAPHLANSPALSTPILGRMWKRIREQMHDLVLFYVNRANRTHSRVDGQLIEAIEALPMTALPTFARAVPRWHIERLAQSSSEVTPKDGSPAPRLQLRRAPRHVRDPISKRR